MDCGVFDDLPFLKRIIYYTTANGDNWCNVVQFSQGINGDSDGRTVLMLFKKGPSGNFESMIICY